MTLNILLLNINAITCFLIAARLLTFKRGTSRHNLIGSAFAYLLIVACSAVTIRIISGAYVQADFAETIINITLCVSLFLSRGNVMNIFRRSDHHARG